MKYSYFCAIFDFQALFEIKPVQPIFVKINCIYILENVQLYFAISISVRSLIFMKFI